MSINSQKQLEMKIWSGGSSINLERLVLSKGNILKFRMFNSQDIGNVKFLLFFWSLVSS